MTTTFAVWLSLVALLVLPHSSQAQSAQLGRHALVLTAEGPLTPAMVNYIQRGVDTAAAQGSEIIVLQLNTPGGAIDLMEKIVNAILESRVPVIVYVAPRGAVAGSAGTLITLAGHANAMAPQTTIGAASPVGGEGQDIGETMEAKVKNVLKAQARTLAADRGPDAVALAEATIEEAKAVTAEEAKAVGLIDIIAGDVSDLLDQLDGRTVKVQERDVLLRTGDLAVLPLEMSFVETLLNLLTNPNIIFLLLFIGVQAILAELSTPGIGLPGLVGVICLALAFYGLGVLPVNWFGMIFIALAVILFLVDLQTGVGLLSVGAVISLVIGVLILFNSPGSLPYFQVSVPFVITMSIAIGSAFLALVFLVLRARRRPVAVDSVTALVGQAAEVRQALNPRGTVQLAGETWSAESDSGPIAAGRRVRVVGVDGLTLKVRPEEEQKS
ncbi:MAG: nodulation protein NfeD [Anaerolineae bacterium]|nr:nodulation protein NfeD [Thermoflexales bacterium]MDW8408803.1 nodulation protein NfeD [Anaerolineae bacterium]